VQSAFYKKKKIANRSINFFCPNNIINWRINTLFSKEPDTLIWIKKFKKHKKIIFWDIGSNIGLYSIYAAIIHKDITVVSFEPSTSNLKILSRNIYINNLFKKIKICQLAITKKNFCFSQFRESRFLEGQALNTFGSSEKKKLFDSNAYTILGVNLNFLVKNKILEVPDYIKIDVDGIEDKIIEGFDKFLYSKKIKSILIEIDEQNYKQVKRIETLMKINKFKFVEKNNTDNSKTNKQFFNYIYNKLN
jgi:FkbM family methyltransferase